MSIRTERAYEASHAGRHRYLVDRLWPRGVKKDALELEGWVKEAAPSDALRRWFNHDPARWAEFERKYFAELEKNPSAWAPLRDAAERGDVTLVFGAKDTQHNNAVALRDYLESKLSRGRDSTGRSSPHR